MKDIHRKDSEAKIGSVTDQSNLEEKRQLQDLFVSLAEGVLAESKREPFTEIKDTIKAFNASRFEEWILSMADSLLFLASMGLVNKGLNLEWNLLDVPSEIQLLEEAREKWNDYRELHDRFSEQLEI